MRILQVRFSNLNSLRDEVHLDFADGPLASAGLFAITGPTGSGKSTILDAISLAMYNKTARNQGHEIVSNGEREANTEVEFEVKGLRYRSTWSMKLTKDRETGELKRSSPKMEVSQLIAGTDTGELRADGLKSSGGVPDYIEQLTGLDFQRFQQSMLLAQGEFDNFLMASDKDRSSLLEQITGSEIYSQVSQLVFQRHSVINADLTTQRKVLASIGAPDSEQVQQWRVDLGQVQEEMPALRTRLKSLEVLAQAYDQREKLQLANATLDQQVSEHQGQSAKMTSIEVQLQAHRKAAQFLPELAAQTSLGRRAAKLNAEHQDIQQQLDVAQALAPELIAKEAFAKTALEKATAAKAEAAVTISQLTGIGEVLAKAELDLISTRKDHTSLSEQRKELQQKIAALEKVLEQNRVAITQAKVQITQLGDIGLLRGGEQKFKLTHEAWWQANQALAAEQKLSVQQGNLLVSREKQLQELQATVPQLPTGILEKDELPSAGERRLKLLKEQLRTELSSLHGFGESLKALLATTKKLELWTQTKLKAEAAVTSAKSADKLAAERFEAVSLELEASDKQLQLSQQAFSAIKALASVRSAHVHLLKIGEPCPLCGSAEHPAGYEISDQDLQAHRQQHEGLVEEVKRLEQLRKSAIESAREAKLAFESATHSLQRAMSYDPSESVNLLRNGLLSEYPTRCQAATYSESQECLAQLRDDYANTKHALGTATTHAEQLSSFISKSGAIQAQIEAQQTLTADAKTTLTELQNRVTACQKTDADCAAKLEAEATAMRWTKPPLHKTAYEDLREHLASHDKLAQEVKLLAERQSKTEAALADGHVQATDLDLRIKKLDVVLSDLTALQSAQIARNKELLGSYADVTAMRASVDSAFAKTSEQSAALSKANAAHKDLLTALNTSQRTLKNQIAETAAELDRLTAGLVSQTTKAGFDTLENLQAAILETPSVESLRAQLDSFKQAKIKLATQRESLKAASDSNDIALKEAPEVGLVTNTALSLQQEIQSKEQSIGVLATKLQQAAALDKQIATQQAALAKLADEVADWDILNKLIGSRNGNKFRQFAQRITLQQLLKYANSYLYEFYPRFSVSPNLNADAKPLEIWVCDHFEADQVRPISTVSGGERFLISLALALGFSRMASRQISIDTLFIDEGFGSLDGETLDKAITAIEKLQQKGKTIGIISHVASLQERIATQIRVQRMSSGRSKVEILD